MVAVCALGLVTGLAGRGAWRGFNAHMFFLGAAFMLLETRSLVTFALLFGSTWLVNTLVFFAILCSVLLAVALSAWLRIRPSPVLYGALLRRRCWWRTCCPRTPCCGSSRRRCATRAASLVAFLPIFLANLVFAGSFRLTGREADLAFASNLLGIMVGGMLEYTALLFGYRNLLLLAIGFYALAALSQARRQPTGSPAGLSQAPVGASP